MLVYFRSKVVGFDRQANGRAANAGNDGGKAGMASHGGLPGGLAGLGAITFALRMGGRLRPRRL
jgi:hypothetical protein